MRIASSAETAATLLLEPARALSDQRIELRDERLGTSLSITTRLHIYTH